MSVTTVDSAQIRDGTVQRSDLNVSTVGQSVVAKLLQGSNISLSSTGADAGTGDVTVSATSQWLGFISKTAAYTLTTADSGKYIICSGGGWTLTLPAPAVGLIYQVRNDMGISGTTGTITLSPTSGTIDGAASIVLLPQQECTLITDGTNWRTFGLKREMIIGTQDITSSTASGTVLLPAGYRLFELEFAAVLVATNDSILQFQLSTDGGSTWIADGLYRESAIFDNSGTTVAYGATNPVSPTLSASLNSSTTVPGWTRLSLYPGTASLAQSWLMQSGGYSSPSGRNRQYITMGDHQVVGLANAFKYFASSGNITNLFLTVKGVV